MKMKEKPIEEFTLPKKWCIKLSTREINDAVNSISLWKRCMLYWENAPHYINYYIGYDGEYSRNLLEEGYNEITFDQFKKYVLKQKEPKTNNMKKPFAITGSVALKEAFVKEAGLSFYTSDSAKYKWIIPCENPENINKMQGIDKLPYNNSIAFSLPQQYKEALEYVKTYWEEEFNVGDWIVVENSNKLQSGCTGCPKGTFQIVDKDKHILSNGLFDAMNGFYVQTEVGIWRISKQGVRKATKEEIKNATELKVGDWIWNSEKGEVFQIEEIHEDKDACSGNGRSNFYYTLHTDSSKEYWSRKATPEEIKEAQKACNLPEMSTYKAEIKKGKLHYGCKSFSKQDVQAIINAAAVLEKFSSYGASLSSTEVKTSDSSLSIEKLKTILNKLS